MEKKRWEGNGHQAFSCVCVYDFWVILVVMYMISRKPLQGIYLSIYGLVCVSEGMICVYADMSL